jgi:hypothetical protein
MPDRIAAVGAANEVCFFENRFSKRKKSRKSAMAGTACKARSTWIGIRGGPIGSSIVVGITGVMRAGMNK